MKNVKINFLKATTTELSIKTWIGRLTRKKLEEFQIFPSKWIYQSADLDSTKHVFWDSSREWKVVRVSVGKEYLKPHEAFSNYEINSAIITLSLQLERTSSYWESLYLFPLILTTVLSASGLFIPS